MKLTRFSRLQALDSKFKIILHFAFGSSTACNFYDKNIYVYNIQSYLSFHKTFIKQNCRVTT